jgi:SAM-dependent methyltransferase
MNRARVVRNGVPLVLLGLATLPGVPRKLRMASASLLLACWTVVYLRYRRAGRRVTRAEWEALRATSWEAFWRHYNERVPTVEEEYEIWGPYHEHRHEMRYDIVAGTARPHLRSGARLLDLGCGSANVADRLSDLDVTYIGADFGLPAVSYSARKYGSRSQPLTAAFLLADAEQLPFASSSFDVVVMSEVIEHLLRPERAVWEIARVLRPGGVFVMTTNNASEAPLRSPLTHPFAWIEKAIGADHPSLISLRPWAWPERVDRDLLPEGSPDVYLPHTHHISAEMRAMFAAAGMDTLAWSTFEFPPPQSRSAAWLEKRGRGGLRIVDMIEAVARRTPGVRRLGTHLLIVARKTRDAVAPKPPAGVWPGPLSPGADASPNGSAAGVSGRRRGRALRERT